MGSSIVAALISMLDADFVFIGLPGHGDHVVTELARSNPKLDPATSVSRDLTEQKASKAALRHLNDNLERRVEEPTFELADANKRLVAEKRQRAQADLRVKKIAE
jgi:C4-dicarboxylate-specific signal transduction histidine kinase